MLIQVSFDDKEVAVDERICPYHKKHPWDKDYAGCTCSITYALIRKSPKPEKVIPPLWLGDVM